MQLTNLHFYKTKTTFIASLKRVWMVVELSYRFGFNGQEKDDEVSGAGNTMSAEFWEYDSRLGRRWNLDPKPDISISGYTCFRNNPIMFNDEYGDTVKFGGFMDKVRSTIGRIFSKEFREKFRKWDASNESYTLTKDKSAKQDLEHVTPNFQLSPSNEKNHLLRYNSGIGFNDVSSTSLRNIFALVRVPFSLAKFTLILPLGAITSLTGNKIPWGAGDKIYGGEKGNELLFLGWGFGLYNEYNWHFGVQRYNPIYPNDGLIGLRFGFTKMHPPNFIDIFHTNKFGIHIHLNMVFPKKLRHKKLNNESILDFYQPGS